MLKITIFIILVLSPLFVCFSQSDKNSFINENYRFYYENREKKDSIINYVKELTVLDNKNIKPNILLGLIYMNENQFDSAIVYLKHTMNLSLNVNDSIGFYTNAAFLLLDAYRYSFRFKEFFKDYSLYWAFLVQDEHKNQLNQLDSTIQINLRWWFTEYSRQVAENFLNQSPTNYVFAFANNRNYRIFSNDEDAIRLIQNNTDSVYWATVMMIPIDESESYYYSFYFHDFKLDSYLKISSVNFIKKEEFSKDKLKSMIKPIYGFNFDKDIASYYWQVVQIVLDNGQPLDVLEYIKDEY